MNKMRKLINATLLSASLLALAASGADASGPHVMLGVHANQDGQADIYNVNASKADVIAVESAIGRKLGIDSEYSPFDGFGTSFPLPQAQWDVQNGRTPMLTWNYNVRGEGEGNCPKWYQIQRGDYDAQLIDQAQVLKALGHPIIVRLYPAMDTSFHSCPYDVDAVKDPVTAGQRFVIIWRHIVDVVRGHGATNVQWDWSPNSHAFTGSGGRASTVWKNFDPGSDYVDWYGSQVYQPTNDAIEVENSPFFLNWYNQMAPRGRLIFSETNAGGPDPQRDPNNGFGCDGSMGRLRHSPQAVWEYSIGKYMPKYPAVQAIVLFSSTGLRGDGECINYVQRGDGMTWLRTIAHRPYFAKMSP